MILEQIGTEDMYINVLELLENSANKYPNRVALRDEVNSVTYAQLHEKAQSTRILHCY